MKNPGIALCILLVLAGCDSTVGGVYAVQNREETAAPEQQGGDQAAFFKSLDASAQEHGMRPISCTSHVAERTCRSYETESTPKVLLTGYVDGNASRYVVTVYEWNVSRRSQVSIDLETVVVGRLRKQFGERVIVIR
jgi:hypothetical protein